MSPKCAITLDICFIYVGALLFFFLRYVGALPLKREEHRCGIFFEANVTLLWTCHILEPWCDVKWAKSGSWPFGGASYLDPDMMVNKQRLGRRILLWYIVFTLRLKDNYTTIFLFLAATTQIQVFLLSVTDAYLHGWANYHTQFTPKIKPHTCPQKQRIDWRAYMNKNYVTIEPNRSQENSWINLIIKWQLMNYTKWITIMHYKKKTHPWHFGPNDFFLSCLWHFYDDNCDKIRYHHRCDGLLFLWQ